MAIISGTSHRGKSSAGRMSNFNKDKYNETTDKQCIVSLDSIEFSNRTMLSGTIKASLNIRHNSKIIHNVPSLGDSNKRYMWNRETVVSYGQLPVSFPVNMNRDTSVEVCLTQVTGIAMFNRQKKPLHT